MIEKEIHGPQFGYHLWDGYILTPLGIGDQYTYFEVDNTYGDWTLDGKEYYLNIKDFLPILNDKTGFHRVELSDIAWKGFDLDMSLRADNCVCCNGNRFRDCNPTMPGILLEGIENPIPIEPLLPRIAVLIPITSPFISNNGPPELPELIEASV